MLIEPKSDAMKKIRHAVTKWGSETFWVYHKVEYFDKNQKGDYEIKEKSYLSDIEFGRLGRDITISLEVIKDDNDRRGVYVKEARRGRTGITIWDDSGTWENIRERIINGVWGGLTKQEQDVIEETLPTSFDSSAEAIRWAVTKYPQLWGDENHTKNSLNKLYKELVGLLGDDFDKGVLWEKWVEKVIGKSNGAE